MMSTRAIATLFFILITGSAAFSQEPPDVSLLQTANPISPTLQGAPRFSPGNGTAEVVVRLTAPPLAAVVGNNAKRVGIRMSGDQQRAYIAALNDSQNALMQSV